MKTQMNKRIMLLKDAIGRLEEIDYYLWDYETEENEFARVIQTSIIMLKEILPKVEKYESED